MGVKFKFKYMNWYIDYYNKDIKKIDKDKCPFFVIMLFEKYNYIYYIILLYKIIDIVIKNICFNKWMR